MPGTPHLNAVPLTQRRGRLGRHTAEAVVPNARAHLRRACVVVIAIAVWVLLIASGIAEAATGSLTYLKDGNVFVTPADGSAVSQVTRDGTPSDPYTSASQSTSGVVVAVRHSTAYRLAQGGESVAAPVPLGVAATGGGAVSPDGGVLAYEGVETCGIVPRACVSTIFRSLSSGVDLIGKGLQMSNPAWSGDRVVGVVAGGVSITGPSQPVQDQWFNYGSNVLPPTVDGTQAIESAAASPDGTRVAVTTTPNSNGDRALWLLTSAGLGGAVTPTCQYRIQSPAPHLAWAPDGSTIAVQTGQGVSTMSIADLSGTLAGCDANLATAKLIATGGSYPSWSQAPYDPRTQSGPGTGGTGTGSPGAGGTGNTLPGAGGHGTVGITPVVPVDRTPSFRIASSTTLKRALRDGIRVLVTCSVRCTASAVARVDARTAQRRGLGRGSTIVARASAKAIKPHVTTPLTLRFSRLAKHRLHAIHPVRVTLSVTRRGRFKTTVATRKVTLR